VLLGAIIAGGVSLWREQVVTTRERVAREAERQLRRKDVRDTFQRETLLALQDAIENLRTATFAEWGRRQEGPSKPYGAWAAGDDRFYQDWRASYVPVKKLWARIFDSELRSLVQDLYNGCIDALTSTGLVRASEKIVGINELVDRVENRIAVLLPDLY
jgi:hypothetical protein